MLLSFVVSFYGSVKGGIFAYASGLGERRFGDGIEGGVALAGQDRGGLTQDRDLGNEQATADSSRMIAF